MTTLTVRKCETTDTKAARSVIEKILVEEFPAEASAYPASDLTDILTSYGKLGESFFVACDGEKVVGTVGIKREDDRVAFLRRLFVDPQYRGKKIGKKLLERAIAFCQEVNYEELVFKTTSAMAGAIALCEKSGFVLRARIDLGPIQLLKYSLCLKSHTNNAKHA